MRRSWYFPLSRVPQNDNHGCGIACVATVCGVTYERARAEFFPRRREFEDNHTIHVSGEAMARVIRKLGFRARYIAYGDHRDVDFPLILTFRWHPNWSSSSRHCVVFNPYRGRGGRIIDPGSDCRDESDYLNLWKKSRYCAIGVTGKRYD